MKNSVYLIALACGGLLLQGSATSKSKQSPAMTDDARAYFEVLRSDFNSSKVQVLDEAMHLTAAEADKFWPVYRDYERDLAPIGDRKLALIREFLSYHKAGTLDEEKARDLAAQWLDNSQARLDLWKKYHRKISESVSPVRAAQFLQVENQLALFVDICIASEMPQVGSPPRSP